MESIALWLIPLILLPGVGLLVMSTSSRYAQVQTEFAGMARESGGSRVEVELLRRRSSLCRDTLVSLYASIGLLACAVLTGGLAGVWLRPYAWLAVALTCAAVASLVYAAVQLIRESLLAMDLVQEQHRRLDASESEIANP
jgi:heme exporter protein D